MVLQSQLFGGDSKLEAAAASDPAHIFRGARGPHVGKIQLALILLDGAAISQDSVYGPATAAAVRAFKQKRTILNFQGKIDDIVGKKTMAALDAEMLTRERGGGGGGGLLNFKLEFITHTLIYFSGVADDFGMGGVLLQGAHGQDVLTDMENLDVLPDLSEVHGFGGSLKDKRKGVDQALTFINDRDPRGELIIYGYSAGGINALDLCRSLNTRHENVHLLVTVDVSGRGEKVDRTVPPNVVRNRNYFQTDTLTFSRAVGGPALGAGAVNIDCNDRNFETLTTKTRHGQMQDITRFEAIRDMRVHIKKVQFTR
jgi:hypothetical protein